MSHADELQALAQEFYDSAVGDFENGRLHVCFNNARQATELACKAVLQRADGEYPREHQVAGRMYERGHIPDQIEPGDLSRLLGSHTQGRYPFEDPVTQEQAEWALELTRILLEAAQRD